MTSKLDVLVIHPNSGDGIYQDLNRDLTAVEPPMWARLVAGYALDSGLSVRIIDAEAENLTANETALRALKYDPVLVVVVVFGHQPSASTQMMPGATRLIAEIANRNSKLPTLIVGGHVSALPERSLQETKAHYACKGEGPVTVVELVRYLKDEELGRAPSNNIPGLVWRVPEVVPGVLLIETEAECRAIFGSSDNPSGVIVNPSAPNLNPAELRGDVWHLLPMDKYRAHNWQCFQDLGCRQPYASIYTSLNCSFKCLAGGTPINTVYGDIPIEQLYADGVSEIPVFTFDPEQQTGLVATARNIRHYGKDSLVRVHFDDGTFIDCTPDHKFLQFKWNRGDKEQWAEEAQNLKPSAHVRAWRINWAGPTRSTPYWLWSRKGVQSIHRSVAEWKIGRKLLRSEHVHHIDHDHRNWTPENLEVYGSAKEHAKQHPENVQRMRDNNPTKNGMDQTWRDNLSKANTGKKRSDISKERYKAAAFAREAKTKGQRKWWVEPDGSMHLSVEPRSALAKLRAQANEHWYTTPDGKCYKSDSPRSVNDVRGRKGFNPRAAKEPELVNHRVAYVEELPGEHNVYCLEVPATGWFYANNVLVKNCEFCCISAPFGGAGYKTRAPSDVVAEIQHLYSKYSVRTFKIVDEMFVLNPKHVRAICQGIIDSGIGDDINIWAYARIDTIKPDMLALMRRAGIQWLALGIESGSAEVRDQSRKSIKTDSIPGIVAQIRGAGINVIGNYIFGLPGDTPETMQQTLDLAMELNCDFANLYVAHAYPGSKLYEQAVQSSAVLPATWSGYSQHSTDCLPLATEALSAREILRFRDAAFLTYFSNPAYLQMIEIKFGVEARQHIEAMTKHKLDRLLLRPLYTFADRFEHTAHADTLTALADYVKSMGWGLTDTHIVSYDDRDFDSIISDALSAFGIRIGDCNMRIHRRPIMFKESARQEHEPTAG